MQIYFMNRFVNLGLAALMVPAAFAALGLSVQAAEFAQTPEWVNGDPLWLVGLASFFIFSIWLAIRTAFRVERDDRRNGRPDMKGSGGGFFGSFHVHDDDDGDGPGSSAALRD